MGAYEEALAGLNKAQRLAVTTTEGPVLVIAGPGTGKTQLLATRIAHILATTDTLPQNILCLTFTDSGAHTMRERLINMIGQAAYDVTISTYHAFGSDIIRRFPAYFADNPDLQPVDELGSDTIFRKIIANLPYTNPLKYADTYLGDVKKLISDAKRALLQPNDLRAVAQHNLTCIKHLSPAVGKALSQVTRLSKKDVAAFESLLATVQAAISDPKNPLPEGVPPLPQRMAQELAAALEDVAEQGKLAPLTRWKNNWLAKDESGHFVIDGCKANQKLVAAAEVYEAYLTELRTRNLFDYDDMILRAVQALENHADLRYSLQEQYLYILLDEFQDTNGAQLKIVQLLTDNPVNEGRPNVLAVGDDDQAIYAFQGADYSHMLEFKRLYREVLLVALTKNYRSHAAILHTSRAIAEQIEERLHHHFPEIEKNITAAGSGPAKKTIVERHEAQSDVMQLAWTAKRILRLLDSGVPANEIAVLAPQHKYIEPLVPFLTQQHVPVRYEKRENILDDPVINQLLSMAQLCVALNRNEQGEADALWSQVLSFDFWRLPTSTIWQLAWRSHDQKHSWTAELLADEQLKPVALFFIRLSQLVDVETLENMLDYMIGSTPLELHEPGYQTYTSPFYTYHFGQLSMAASEHGLEPAVRNAGSALPAGAEVSQTSLFNERAAESAGFWEVLTNLIVLRARLREYRRDGDIPLYLQDLLDFVQAHRAAELKILNTNPHNSGDQAVQLMTAFKAKGMEFTAVFVLAVSDEAWGGKAHGAGNRISLPPNLAFMRYGGATQDERLRLFYVALTRAKSQLYLVNYVQNYAGKIMSRLKYLQETTDEQGQVHSPLLPAGKQRVLPAEDAAAPPTTELAAYWNARHHTAIASSGTVRDLLLERLKRFQLSPTHLNDFTDLLYCGPQTFFLRTVLRFPMAPRAEVQFGNAIHETLEWLHAQVKQHGSPPKEQAVQRIYRTQLQSKRLNPADTSLFLERGIPALSAYVAQRGPSLALDSIAEYNFRNEGVFIGKAHLTGKIDKLIIDRQTKTITIVDYKTGKSFERWAPEVKLHKYKTQLYLYRALVEGSHTYSGYRVTDAYLEFVEPDEQGTIRELHLAFDEAEYSRVKRLAETIWQKITRLDLPDITTYTSDLSGVKAFEDDLLSLTAE